MGLNPPKTGVVKYLGRDIRSVKTPDRVRERLVLCPAMGRALMSRPRVLLLDEPSMGLAPLFVKQIFEIIGKVRDEGVTVLLVEQNAHAALAIANRAYVLETGEVTLSGAARDLADDASVKAAYLGL